MNKIKTPGGLCIGLMIIVAGFLTFSPARGEEQEKISHRIFRIINRNASDMEKLVKVFLSPEGQVVSDDRAQVLIVKDYPSVIGRIGEFLPQVDTPLPQVRIYVRFNDTASSAGSGWGVAGGMAGNSWVVGAWGGSQEHRGSSSGTMHLITLSGTWGEIACGEQVFSPQWFFDYAMNGGYITAVPVYRSVSTGFAVMPIVRGDTVEMTVAPQISYFTDAGRTTIRFEKAAATVTVKSGQSIALGASNSEGSAVVRQVLGSLTTRQSQSNVLILTPVIDK